MPGEFDVTHFARDSIALDLHLLGAHETGNETYARELAISLCANATFDYKLLVPERGVLPTELQGHPGVTEIGRLPSILRVGIQYPRLLANLKMALGHMPTYILPPRMPCASVVTVPDVSYLLYPELVEPRVRLMLRALVGPSIRAATMVVAVSESSRRDILRLYRADPAKVAVTPLAAAKHFKHSSHAEIERVRAKYQLAQTYVLSVGTIVPRKNITRLVEAFAIVARTMTDIQLAIVGKSAWKGSGVENRVRQLGLAKQVRFVGYVPAADLPALYSGAAVFCYPSLHEGFGLPALEAMACGVPTVTSATSSLPEVVGEAGLMFQPESITEMAADLQRVLADVDLSAKLAAKGRSRAALFSWDRTAHLTEAIYYNALARYRHRELC